MSKETKLLKNLLSAPYPINENPLFFNRSELIEFMLKYQDLVKIDGDNIVLDHNGRKWVIKNRKKLFLTRLEKSWELIPEHFLLHNKE